MADIHSKPTIYNFLDLTGQIFDRLTVLTFQGKLGKTRRVHWLCKCECGNEKITSTDSLRSGRVRSCGCLQTEARFWDKKHGHGRQGQSSEYKSYHAAKGRCENPKDARYADYGGRGIEFRFHDFTELLDYLGYKPSPEYTIDRYPDNDGHYEKGNVRWATEEQQQRNRRNTIPLIVDGVSHLIVEWAEITGIDAKAMYARRKKGWCDTCIVTLPSTVGNNQGSGCPHRS